MKKKSAFFLLFLLTSLASFSQTSAQQPIDATDCNNKFFTALLEEDATTLGSLLTDDFTITSMEGQLVDKGTLQQGVSQGYVVVQSGMVSGVQTKNYTDVAIVRGSWNVKASIENNSFIGEVSFMTVCAKSGGNWKVAAVQLTPVR